MSEGIGFLDPNDLPEGHPLKQMIAAHERRHLEVHDFSNRWHRLIAEEMSYEHVDLLRMMLSTIADSQACSQMANWYEGQVAGALAVRRVVLNQAPEEEMPT